MAKRSFRNIDCTNRFSKPVRSVQTQRDPAFEKVQFKKVDTEIFFKISIYKKASSLNKPHFLIHSLILVKFPRNWHH